MSVKTLALAWDNSIHKGSELLVLVAIAENSNDDTDSTYLSIEFIAWKTRLSRRSVQRIISTLEKSGELLIQRNRGRNGTNVYRITTTPGNYGLRPNTRNAMDGAFETQPSESETASGGANLSPVTFEVVNVPNSVVDAPNSVVEHTPDDTRTVEEPLSVPLENRRDNIDFPEWFKVASAVKTWNMTYEKAEAWRVMAKVSVDLAERKAYGLASWMTPKRIKEGRKAYDSWQAWCREDRDNAGSGRGAQRQPVKIGQDFKGYGDQ